MLYFNVCEGNCFLITAIHKFLWIKNINIVKYLNICNTKLPVH
jgi:hypothetical protein